MTTQTFNYGRLKEAREELGWSQEKLVAELYAQKGVEKTRATWIRYENGETEPGMSEMLLIAEVLQKPLKFFLS